MKRWIAFVAALYPRSWREEFGQEFDALLEDVRPRWHVFADVLGGAITMQMTTGNNWLKMVLATSLAGAVLAGGLSFTAPPHYESSAAISVTPQPDPVRPASPQLLHQQAADNAVAMETMVMSRAVLSAIIHDPSLPLYTDELKRMPLDYVIQQMRHDIHIQARSRDDGLSPIVVDISFSYPDQAKAQRVVSALAGKFTDVYLGMNSLHADTYRFFWQGKAAADPTMPTPPPPPPLPLVKIIDPASLSVKSSGPNRILFLAWGLGVGLLSGLLAALALRWPHSAKRLGGFAAAGCVVVFAASFLIPNRYTSSGVMMLESAVLTEDPLSPLPPVTQAAAFLRQIEPEVLSVESLSAIVQDRRLNLYPAERAKMPIEAVARKMLANDLRIEPLIPASPEAKGVVSAFRISFSYPDRFKAQQTVFALMNAFDEWHLAAGWKASRTNVTLRQINSRKAGEELAVLDVASLPAMPVFPNRPVIAAAGLSIGLLLGALILFFRPHRAAAFSTDRSANLVD